MGCSRKEGPAALAHGNRGRRPANAIPDGTRERVLTLARERYRELNHTHLADARTLAEANAVLGEFPSRFNARFGIPAAQAGSAYRMADLAVQVVDGAEIATSAAREPPTHTVILRASLGRPPLQVAIRFRHNRLAGRLRRRKQDPPAPVVVPMYQNVGG